MGCQSIAMGWMGWDGMGWDGMGWDGMGWTDGMDSIAIGDNWQRCEQRFD